MYIHSQNIYFVKFLKYLFTLKTFILSYLTYFDKISANKVTIKVKLRINVYHYFDIQLTFIGKFPTKVLTLNNYVTMFALLTFNSQHKLRVVMFFREWR